MGKKIVKIRHRGNKAIYEVPEKIFKKGKDTNFMHYDLVEEVSVEILEESPKNEEEIPKPSKSKNKEE